MIYRPEIDGLRALAVLPVILYHSGFHFFGGGFVGVDIFFVISGYLITSIILTERKSGVFTLLGFYSRRIRRILPALYLILVVSSIVCLILLSPFDGNQFWQSEFATILFASNILFLIKSSDYFSLASEYMPLLHTWSLAVEEQYYILYPLLLLTAWRFGKSRLVVLLFGIAIASLVAAQWTANNSPSAGFYLLPTRAWELLIGAVIALYLDTANSNSETLLHNVVLCEVCGVVGLVMIGLALLLFDKITPFPSIFALLPTVGAGFIILFANSQTQVGRLLGNKLFVGTGLISYSAYLWHQPLLVFARYYILSDLSIIQSLIVVALTFGLAVLSWKFVEQPFRSKQLVSNRVLFSIAGTVSIALLLVGYYGHLSKGFKDAKLSLITEDRKSLFVDFYAELGKKQQLWMATSNSSPKEFGSDLRTKVLILGDSMSGDLLMALTVNPELSRGNEFVRQDLAPSTMGAFLEYLVADDESRSKIHKFPNHFVNLKRLIGDSQEVVLAGNWTRATIPLALTLAEHLSKHSKQIYVVDTLRIFHMSSSSFYFVNSSLRMEELNNFMYKRLSSEYLSIRKYLRNYRQRLTDSRIKVIDKGSFFCDFNSAVCALYSKEGDPLFFDELHLTVAGARVFGHHIEENGYFIR